MEYDEIKEKMSKALEVLEQRLAEIRAGRANPAILNKVKIDYYGTPTPINQVAGISVPEARLIVIQPWETIILKKIVVIAVLTMKIITLEDILLIKVKINMRKWRKIYLKEIKKLFFIK